MNPEPPVTRTFISFTRSYTLSNVSAMSWKDWGMSRVEVLARDFEFEELRKAL
jgi:hypothetical protein